MVTVREAAEMLGVTSRAIYLWVKQRRVHEQRTPGGQIRICQNSLAGLALPSLSTRVSPDNVWVNKALDLIYEQYSFSDLTLGKLARQLGISVWHLSRSFNKHAGIGFRQIVRTVRMEKASELLQNRILSVKQVAGAVGYKHVSDFDHHFKTHYGLTPGSYRRHQHTHNE
jgi:excisionase family DNA binding protein